MDGTVLRRGERQAWRRVATAAHEVAEARGFAQEYVAKSALRAAWARLNGIPHVSGIPRSQARP